MTNRLKDKVGVNWPKKKKKSTIVLPHTRKYKIVNGKRVYSVSSRERGAKAPNVFTIKPKDK